MENIRPFSFSFFFFSPIQFRILHLSRNLYVLCGLDKAVTAPAAFFAMYFSRLPIKLLVLTCCCNSRIRAQPSPNPLFFLFWVFFFIFIFFFFNYLSAISCEGSNADCFWLVLGTFFLTCTTLRILLVLVTTWLVKSFFFFFSFEEGHNLLGLLSSVANTKNTKGRC